MAGTQHSPLDFSPEGKEYGAFAADVRAADGLEVAKAGERLSPQLLQRFDANRTAVLEMSTTFQKTHLFKDIRALIAHPIYSAPFGAVKKRHEFQNLVKEARVPQSLLPEMTALKKVAPWAYDQALVSGALAVLLLQRQGVPEDTLREGAIASFIRDVGMSRIDRSILRNVHKLDPEQYKMYMTHEIISAALIARVTGSSLATRIACSHHRTSDAGRWLPYAAGYKASMIGQLVKTLVIADAFVGMISPRSYRISSYDTRGAVAMIVEGAKGGRFDLEAAKQFLAYCKEELPAGELEGSSRGKTPTQNEYGVSK